MRKQTQTLKQIAPLITVILLIVSLLVSCQLLPSSTPTPDESLTENSSAEALVTPPDLPVTFQSTLLNPLDTPHVYTEETCKYLRNKWNPLNAEPGTVVLAILFNNINRGTADLPGSINVQDFKDLMEQLRAQGFEAIDSKQLQAFVERNIKIPPRSVVLIQVGNQNVEFFEVLYQGYFEKYGWPVVNAWVSDNQTSEAIRQGNFLLEEKGLVDHQAGGISPDRILSDNTAKIVIARELQGSLDGFAATFSKTPTMVIWPNGGFGIRPVDAARQLRFKLGFTANARGPIMYNWVPLADEVDPARPDLIPEGPISDPVMTLPAFPAEEALNAIDLARIIGKEAKDYALSNKDIEHTYYEIVCADAYGPMPTP